MSQKNIDPFICPRCNGKVIPALPCENCGKWWEHFNHPSSGGEFSPAGDLLAKIAHRLECIPKDATMLDIGGGSGVAGWIEWKRFGVSSGTIIDKFDYKFPPQYADFPTEFIVGDGLDALELFEPQSFDIVQSTEVLEHIPKEDGERFLDILYKLCRRFVGISTPNGYARHDWRMSSDGRENPYQDHLCGWTQKELKQLGWNCHANGGVRSDGVMKAFQNVAFKYRKR